MLSASDWKQVSMTKIWCIIDPFFIWVKFRSMIFFQILYTVKLCINRSMTASTLGPSLPWSYGSWIYNCLCNQCLLPLMLWGWISIRVRCTTLYDKACQWLATCQWFSPGTPVSSSNKTDRHDITEILFKVTLKTIPLTPHPYVYITLTPHPYVYK